MQAIPAKIKKMDGTTEQCLIVHMEIVDDVLNAYTICTVIDLNGDMQTVHQKNLIVNVSSGGIIRP